MSSGLTEKSTLEELFDFVAPEEEDAIGVFPVTMKPRVEGRAEMMIVITGAPNTANVIMANLMTAVGDMHDLAAQQQAEEEPEDDDDDGPSIIVP